MMTAEAIEANAPIRFAATLKALGIAANIVGYLTDCRPDTARTMIGQLAGTKADKQAVLDAYDLFLAESGQVIYKPGPKMLMK